MASPTPLKAILVDDEPLLVQHLSKLLSKHWSDLSIVATANDGSTGLVLIKQHSPDIVFLDIKMPRLSGLDVAKSLYDSNNPALLVFVTAFDDHAVEAFEHQAMDYLLKPIDEKRLVKTILHLQEKLEPAENRSSAAHENHLKTIDSLLSQVEQRTSDRTSWLKVNHLNDIHLVSYNDIIYVKAQDKYTTVVTTDKEYTSRKTIKELSDQFAPNQFMQISRGTIVNINFIDKIARDSKSAMYVCIKDSKTELKISRNYADSLKRL